MPVVKINSFRNVNFCLHFIHCRKFPCMCWYISRTRCHGILQTLEVKASQVAMKEANKQSLFFVGIHQQNSCLLLPLMLFCSVPALHIKLLFLLDVVNVNCFPSPSLLLSLSSPLPIRSTSPTSGASPSGRDRSTRR